MLNAVRRGPASLTRLLSLPFVPSICAKAAPSLRLSHNPPRTLASTTSRPFSCFPRLNQAYAQQARREYEEIEDEVEDEVNSQRPPSNSEIDAGAGGGLVTKFADLLKRKMVSYEIVRTLTEDMGLVTMTQVQSMTINETLKGVDTLAQARTGTGKTLAFLIPVLQNIITADPSLERKPMGRIRSSGADIRAIIISPTRELAEQIAVEANKVVRHTGIIVQTAVGGSQKSFGLRLIRERGCHILVGTPGRLNDILSDEYSGVRAPKLSALVLDEADRLLDQGFSQEIRSIQELLPDRRKVDRQTLLFSATVPREVMQIVRQTMKPDFKYVRTVQEGEQQTHEKVPQKLVMTRGLENMMPTLLELIYRELKRPGPPFKAIVYFAATAEVNLTSSTFRNLKNPGESAFARHPLDPCRIYEINGRLSQQQRTRAADSFRAAKSAILFSSDVTARGMDFPNVTHVIQVGLPRDQDTYIHRLGRTARGDKTGEGWLLLADMEASDVGRRLRKMPLTKDTSLRTAQVDMTQDASLPEDIAKILTQITNATKQVPFSEKASAYLASLGVYSAGGNKNRLVESLNDLSKYGWGLEKPPAVRPSLAQKLGFSMLRGLNIGRDEESDESDSGYGSSPRGFGGSSRGGSSRGGYGAQRSEGGYGGRRGGFSGGGRGGDRGFSQGGYSSGSRGGFSGGSRGSYGDSERSGGSSRGSYGDSERPPRRDNGSRSRGSYGDSERSSRGNYGGGSRGGFGDRGGSNGGNQAWKERGRTAGKPKY